MSLCNDTERLVSGAGVDCLMESLEARVMLATAPLPSLADLENPSHTVVRIETNFGDIDIELLDSVAPNTVANFLNYVRDGDYDHTIFHRLDDDFVLQGGGFRFTDEGGADEIPTDAPINNEFGRSNVARTIAMAKTSNPNSATSQFFFNLGDNSASLDNPANAGGFTVFARVLDDRSWDIIMTINELNTQAFQPPFGELPVTDDWDGDTSEDTLVFVHNVEVIKPGGTDQFYDEFAYYPEGFTGSTINEFLPLGNPNDEVVYYQVIARAEIDPAMNDVDFDGWFRDRVIATGAIQPNTRGGITISTFQNTSGDLLPQGIPYSLEVHSTLPITANISHFDFGSATGEAFTTITSTTWAFGEAHKANNGEVFEFVVWQNPNAVEANVTIDFYVDGQGVISRTFTTDAYRRGGLAFNDFADLPDGATFGMVITSDQPIVAALSQYGNAANPSGATTLGLPGDASVYGVLPMASVGTTADHQISVLNPNAAPALVRLRLTFTDGRPDRVLLPPELVVPGMTRRTFDLSSVTFPSDPDSFSLLYEIAGATPQPIYMTTMHRDSFTVDSMEIDDRIGTSVPTSAAEGFLFAEGFMDPARAGDDLFETVSIFNPNFAFFGGAAEQTAAISVRFFFADGFEVVETFNVEPGKRVDIHVHTLDSILNRTRSDPTLPSEYFYSVEVTSNVPIVAQMSHYDLTLGDLQPSGGFLTVGTPIGDVIRLDELADGIVT